MHYCQDLHLLQAGRRANNKLWYTFYQLFKAEGTLLSDSSNNELLNYKFGNGQEQTKIYFQSWKNAVPHRQPLEPTVQSLMAFY